MRNVLACAALSVFVLAGCGKGSDGGDGGLTDAVSGAADNLKESAGDLTEAAKGAADESLAGLKAAGFDKLEDLKSLLAESASLDKFKDTIGKLDLTSLKALASNVTKMLSEKAGGLSNLAGGGADALKKAAGPLFEKGKALLDAIVAKGGEAADLKKLLGQ